MVTVTQDFNCRYPLIQGQGNYGSLDGDPPAAMRYTEATFTPIGYQMLKDIEKNTCDMIPNYDNTLLEPKYLPGLLPLGLMNGTEGVAVGMASKMVPHNLTEILDAVDYIINEVLNEKEPDENEIFKIIKGPDFPLGGNIVGRSGILNAYKTGKGTVKIRSVYEIRETKNSTEIVITEIPYKVNKSELVAKMNNLVKIDNMGVKDIRDESDKNGISIIIELKKSANVQLVINKFLKHTDLEKTISINNTVLVNNQPKVLNLVELLEHYLQHCLDVIKRRSEFDLNKANERMHILKAILWAIESEDRTDEVISTIRNSKKTDEAIENLIQLSNNTIDEIQAKAIIEIRLRTLTTDNVEQFIKEKEDLETVIVKLTNIIEDPEILLQQLRVELQDLKDKFGDERRSKFISDDSIDEIDCIEEETLVITFSSSGTIKSVEEKEYRSTNRGAKGTKAANVKEDEAILTMLTVNSKDDLLFFTTLGKCHVLKAYKINKTSRIAKGRNINNYLTLEDGEKIVSMISTDLSEQDNSFAFVTRNGIIKKLAFKELSTVRSVTRVISFREDDMLVTAEIINDNDNIIITTANGMSIRFLLSDVRASGRSAVGVKGIDLKEDDYVVDAVKVEDNATLLTVTENGMAKRSSFDLYSTQSRGGKGTRTHKVTEKTGKLICATSVTDNNELFIATANGQIGRINVDSIREAGKSTSGVKIINLAENDTVCSVSRNIKEQEEENVIETEE